MSPIPAAGWLVAGADGMLGRELTARLALQGIAVTALGRAALDVTDPASARAAVARHRPAVVVNCAAWTAVDAAESHPAQAMEVNGAGPAHLAHACRRSGARLLQLSTDYVFAGLADRPYREDDPPGPRTVYGMTKLAGERAVLGILPETGYVVRTAWLYGAGGRNFVSTMIRLAAGRDTVPVVDDQHGQPTWTADLADRLVALGTAALRDTAPAGVYHATNTGGTTWYALARETFRLLGADPDRIRPTSSGALDRPAPRPGFSLLDQRRWQEAGMGPLREWREALAEAFPALRDAAGRAEQGR
ncbi:dTDP-4-dehydrorhamnose reductase [Streptomyces griseocarneus]|uniref:dTDP-4-dehydrorhamnose reductase n=1 Tax=Streptomyces griseocarneus TaxID=51201 RepID=UPI00167E9550|nr:dTDP-4-dehydrorhamnose reductase [Streptomyces griseocarneus]MBZ6474050.1 dTDP-4-dehydrorhamnose reductase [Streptomyces griseocarneus]GHG51833.1 NAD(P)-dependent oxidoreductase [Streptomyces griseocarneus]